MKEVICVLCPQGCHLRVDEDQDYQVTGNRCRRGLAYGRDEVLNPRRVVTSTVKLLGSHHRRCPVKTDRPIPKALVRQAMALLDGVELRAPVKRGDLVIGNLLGLDANFIVTRDLSRQEGDRNGRLCHGPGRGHNQ